MIFGFVSELNPLHKGHQYLLREIRRQYPKALIITAMSGDFVQRGEPACFSKWKRSQHALRAGCDIVFEIPALFSLQNAQRYALYGIRILRNAGADGIFFGAEHPEIRDLLEAARLMDESACTLLSANNRYAPEKSYADRAIRIIENSLGFTPGSNDMLALEYIRAFHTIPGYRPLLFPIQRIHGNFNESKQNNYSASSIRLSWKRSKRIFLPDEDRLYSLIKAAFCKGEILDMDIDHSDARRIQQAVFSSDSFEEAIGRARHKRLSRSRVRRFLVRAALGLTEDMYQSLSGVPFCRVLAIAPRLKSKLGTYVDTTGWIMRRSDLELIDSKQKALFTLNAQASQIYAMLKHEALRAHDFRPI